MPLVHSSAKWAVGENIRREKSAGKRQDVAVAIALNTQREARGAPRRSKVENASHGPGKEPREGMTRQRHEMGEGRAPMSGGNFGISEYPGKQTLRGHGEHMPHDGVHLKDEHRAGPPALHMGPEHMHATAHSHHGPHHHHAKHHHLTPEETRPHHIGGKAHSGGHKRGGRAA